MKAAALHSLTPRVVWVVLIVHVRGCVGTPGSVVSFDLRPCAQIALLYSRYFGIASVFSKKHTVAWKLCNYVFWSFSSVKR